MKKILLLITLAMGFSSFSSASSMMSFLEKEWISKNGDQMCKYENGTVLNVGSSICPLSVGG